MRFSVLLFETSFNAHQRGQNRAINAQHIRAPQSHLCKCALPHHVDKPLILIPSISTASALGTS